MDSDFIRLTMVKFKRQITGYHYKLDYCKQLVARGRPSARFENMVAGHLLKYCHYAEDTE